MPEFLIQTVLISGQAQFQALCHHTQVTFGVPAGVLKIFSDKLIHWPDQNQKQAQI